MNEKQEIDNKVTEPSGDASLEDIEIIEEDEEEEGEEITEEDEKLIPKGYVNSITREIYFDPVTTKGGRVHEKQVLIEHAKKYNYLTPHRVYAKGSPVISIKDLKNNISEWLEQNPKFKKMQFQATKEYPPDYVLGEMSRSSIGKLADDPKEVESVVVENVHNQNRVNEDSPLIPAQNQHHAGFACVKIYVIGTVICVALGGVVALIVLLKKDIDPVLFSEFKTPYAGGGTIIIHNDNQYSLMVSAIRFDVNSVIDTKKEGVIYGDLAPWGESNIQLVASSGNSFTYQVSIYQKIYLEGNAQKNFTYVFSSAKGALNVSTLPENIQVISKDSVYSLKPWAMCANENCHDPAPGNMLGGYYTTWDMYQRKYDVTNIPVNKLNFINYAFLMPNPNGDLSLHDPNSDNLQLPMLTQLSSRYPYLKISFSIGGYGPPCSAFTALAANPIARQNFANNVKNAIQQFKFHGVDVDWEYPGKDDAVNFVELLKNLRIILGGQYRITIAAPGGADHIHAIGYLWKNVSDVVDAINVMAYDLNGPWSFDSDYQSPLDLPQNDPNGRSLSINYILNLYQNYGVPNEKVVLGLPGYFRGVYVDSMNQFGLWQRVNGTPSGQFDSTGTYDYSCVVGANCYEGEPFPKNCNYMNETVAPYANYSHTPLISCPNIGVINQQKAIFTGDSVQSVQDKTCYVTRNNYKGIFFWTLSGDVRNNDSHSLVNRALNSLHKPCNSSNTLKDNENSLVYDATSWKMFTSDVEKMVLSSSFGGVVFTFVFKIVDKMTDALLQSFFNKVHFKEAEYNLAAYYSVKTALYMGALYYLGLPLLPAAAGKAFSAYFQYMCLVSKDKAVLGGTIASFLMNFNWELNSLESFLLGFVNLLSSWLGSTTTDEVIEYAAEKQKVPNAFGFFKRWMGYRDQRDTVVEDKASEAVAVI